jgi:voltage-gated potassium channel
MEQVSVSPTSALANRTIRDAGLRERFGVIVVGIQHATGQIDFNPAPEKAIQGQDKLVVLGRPDSLKKLETEAAK